MKICDLFQIVYFWVMMSERKIVDSHFHIFDLEVRNNYPDQNPSHGFPSAEQPEINRSFAQFSPLSKTLFRSHTIEEAGQEMAARGIKNAVFVQCYNDCPEEIDWVFKQASWGSRFKNNIDRIHKIPSFL